MKTSKNFDIAYAASEESTATMRACSNVLNEILFSTVQSISHSSSQGDLAKQSFVRSESDEDCIVDQENNTRAENFRNNRVTAQEVITKRLLEGHVLQKDLCKICMMPLMEYEGVSTCAVCTFIESESKAGSDCPSLDKNLEQGDSKKVKTSCKIAFPLTIDEDKQDFIDAITLECTETRARVTEVYTTKIIEGYVMNEDLCQQCDMPMMEYKNTIVCIFCEKTKALEEDKKDQVDVSNKTENETATSAKHTCKNEDVDENDGKDLLVNKVTLTSLLMTKDQGEFVEDSSFVKNGNEEERIDEPTYAENNVAEKLLPLKAECNSSAKKWDPVHRDIVDTEKNLHFFPEHDSTKAAIERVMTKVQKKESTVVFKEPQTTCKLEGRDDFDVIEEEDWDKHILQGFSKVCQGKECNAANLVLNMKGIYVCAVCGGSGNGKDGAYRMLNTSTRDMPEETSRYTDSTFLQAPTSFIMGKSSIKHQVQNTNDCFQLNDDKMKYRVNCEDAQYGENFNTESPQHVSCSIHETILPSLKSLFTGVSGFIKKDIKLDRRQEAKQRIKDLLYAGWQVSAESCPECDMPIFSKGHGVSQLKICCICRAPQKKIDTVRYQQPPSIQNHNLECETNSKMAHLMQIGWKISPTMCTQCMIPTLVHPITNEMHCVQCNLCSNQRRRINHDTMNLDDNMQDDVSQRMVSLILLGWSVTNEALCKFCQMPMLQDPQNINVLCVKCGIMGSSTFCQPHFKVSAGKGVCLETNKNSNKVLMTHGKEESTNNFTEMYKYTNQIVHPSHSSQMLKNKKMTQEKGKTVSNIDSNSNVSDFSTAEHGLLHYATTLPPNMNKFIKLGWTVTEQNCQICHSLLVKDTFNGRFMCLSCDSNVMSSPTPDFHGTNAIFLLEPASGKQSEYMGRSTRGRDPTPSHTASNHFFQDPPCN